MRIIWKHNGKAFLSGKPRRHTVKYLIIRTISIFMIFCFLDVGERKSQFFEYATEKFRIISVLSPPLKNNSNDIVDRG